jgi:methyl coenzyme M reductase subunit D
MNKAVITATVLVFFCLQSVQLLAQFPSTGQAVTDSLKSAKKKLSKADSLAMQKIQANKKSVVTQFNEGVKSGITDLLKKDTLKKVLKIQPTSISADAAAHYTKTKQTLIDTLKVGKKKFSKVDSLAMGKIQATKKSMLAQADQRIKQSDIAKLLKKDTLKKGNKIQFSDVSVGNETQYIKTQNPANGKNLLNNVTFSGQLKVYNIPIDLSLANTYTAMRDFRLDQGNLFKFNLPKPGFNQFFKADLDKYRNLRKNVLSGQTAEIFLRKKVQDKIAKNIDLSTAPKLQAYLNNPQNLRSMLKMDELELKEKLNEFTDEIKEQAQNGGKQLSQHRQDSLTNILNAKKQELFTEIKKVQQSMNESGLDAEKLELLEKVAQGKISQRELENFFISELSKGKDMGFMQKSYARLREFQAGNFGHQLPGSFLNRNLFLNGFNFSLRTARGPVSIGVSTNRDLNSTKDAGFNSSTYAIPKLYSYLSVPTTNFSFGSGKLSWVGTYDRQFNGNIGFAQNALPRNNMVFTLSQAFNFSKAGTLTFDVSKSSTQYKELAAFGPDQLMIDRNTNGNYFRDDFLQTMSVGLNHSIDSKKLGLRSSVFVNYAGSGFQNPGQQGIGNLNLRFGGNIRKDFFHNKMTLTVRSDFKNMPISATDNSHWSNHNIQLDSRFRISRSANLGLKYIDNGVDKVSQGSRPVYASKKLQLDLNSNYKLFGQRGFSHISVAQQEIANPLSLGNSSLMQLNYVQTVVFKGFSLSGNLFYNRELNANTILGNMLNSDASLQYQLFRGISMSSGLSYLDNQNLARQAGIKQSIQFMLKKHFDISAYLDIRKNLITPTYPDLFSTNRGEISIHYYLDKQ